MNDYQCQDVQFHIQPAPDNQLMMVAYSPIYNKNVALLLFHDALLDAGTDYMKKIMITLDNMLFHALGKIIQ